MSSVKNLKKEINATLGSVIESVYAWELENPKADSNQSSEIIDESIATFDGLIQKVNTKTDKAKAHYKSIQKELEEKSNALLEKIGNLK